MERRSFLKKAGVTAGAGLLAACSGKGVTAAAGGSNEKVEWTLASSFPKSVDAIFGSAEKFAARVKELTGGNFTIHVKAAGEVVPPLEVLGAVQNKTVQIGQSASYYYFGKDATFAFDTAIPFGLTARQHVAWMMHGGGMELMREFFKQYNIVNFLGGNTGTQMGGWYKKEIKTLADLNGLKLRTSGFAGKVMSKLGVVPQQLPAGEIYTALEKGTIDGVEWVGPYDDEKLGFYKVAPFYYYPGWWEGGPEVDFFVNQKAFDGLSAENKAIIEAATNVAHVDMLAKYDAMNPKALKQLVAAKTKVLPFSQAVMDASFKASMEVFAENDAKSPEWKKIYADMRAFQRDQILWFRFAEARYDTFMSAQKI